MREARFVEHMKALDADEAVELLHAIVQSAEDRHEDCEMLLLTLVNLRHYQRELGYRHLAAIYLLADTRGYEDVKRLISAGRAVQRMGETGEDENPHLDVTLGERKQLAYTSDRNMIDRLVFDRNPQVIRRLLRNPQLTESNVVKIAAMRPTRDTVIQEVVRAGKWIARYQVKKAVICNPYTPVNIALSLLPFMMKMDLEEISSYAALSDDLKEAAGRRARERSGASQSQH